MGSSCGGSTRVEAVDSRRIRPCGWLLSSGDNMEHQTPWTRPCDWGKVRPWAPIIAAGTTERDVPGA